MKEVLFLIPNLGFGGAERVLVNLVNNLDYKKYHITVCCLFDEGVHKEKLRPEVEYTFLFKKMFRGYTQVFKLFSPESLYKKWIKKEYDVIVSYLEGPTARILSGNPFEKTKMISWIHIEQHTKRVFAHSFRSFKEAVECYRKFNEIICVSENVKKDFTDITGIKENVSVLYNTNETEEIVRLSEEIVSDVEFSSEINICSVAKIMHTKGFDRLAEVHKTLKNKGLKHHIYILGTGEDEKQLKKYIHDNQLEETFHLLGFQKNPYKYMKKCDLYVCSSRREGFSTAVTEAMVLGIPVLSTKCSGAQELLGYNNEYGIVVENSTQGIMEGLEKFLSTPELLEYYREKAQIRGKDFEKSKTVKEVEKLLDSL